MDAVKSLTETQESEVIKMFDEKQFRIKLISAGFTVKDIAKVVGINETTLYRKIKGITDFSTPPEEVVAEVEKWAEEHRPKTRQEKFLEQFPKAKLFTDGVLDLCPEDLEGS